MLPVSTTPPGDRTRGGIDRGRLLFWSLLLVLLGVGAWILFAPRGPSRYDLDDAAGVGGNGVGVRPVVLYFADTQARGFVNERREVRLAEALEAQAEATIRELLRGPDQQNAAIIAPRGARLLQVFFDEENSILYLDFNTAMVTQHPGGSTAEYYTLGALVRTISANFPQVRGMQILVDGQPIDSLAGHYDTSHPLDLATWQ